MSLAQLEYFVAVAEAGSIGRAAQRLCISQPPLTRQIHALEAELGAQLFARRARGVELLEAGQRLLPRAREVLRAAEAARLCCAELPARRTAR